MIPKIRKDFDFLEIIKDYFSYIPSIDFTKEIFKRIGISLLITIPFLFLFIQLFFSADINFNTHFHNNIRFDFNLQYIILIPVYFLSFILFYIFTFANTLQRDNILPSKKIDILIVSIFLTMLNILFITFVYFQIPFLIGKDFLPSYIDISYFARQGFFQLMSVMSIVLLITLFIIKRLENSKLIVFLLSGLLIQTLIIGTVSLKRMYLYQSLKGATQLRYYVEWIDYFLIFILILSTISIIRKINYHKIISIITIFFMLFITIISSIDINKKVALYNQEKLHLEYKPFAVNPYEKAMRHDCKDGFKYYNIGFCYKVKKDLLK
jgi:hypothetical protein